MVPQCHGHIGIVSIAFGLYRLLIILPLGALLAGMYVLTDNSVVFPPLNLSVIMTYVTIIAIGALFAHKKNIIRDEKNQTSEPRSEHRA